MRTALIASVLLASAGVASADIIQLSLSGNVTSSNMTAFPLGQTVNVVLTYESNGSPQFIFNNQAFYVNHFRTFSMSSGSYSTAVAGNFGQIAKYDNLTSADGIQFQAASHQAYYQHTNPRPAAVTFAPVFSNNLTQTLENIFINLASNNPATWNTLDLPTSYNFAAFDQTINMNFGFSDSGFSTGITTLLYENLSVPTPGTTLLLAMGGLLAARRRR